MRPNDCFFIDEILSSFSPISKVIEEGLGVIGYPEIFLKEP